VHCRQHIQLHLRNILEQSPIYNGYGLLNQLLSGTVSWEKYNSDIAQKCDALQMGSTMINEKKDFAIPRTLFSI
jgi:hypothetical protein